MDRSASSGERLGRYGTRSSGHNTPFVPTPGTISGAFARVAVEGLRTVSEEVLGRHVFHEILEFLVGLRTVHLPGMTDRCP